MYTIPQPIHMFQSAPPVKGAIRATRDDPEKWHVSIRAPVSFVSIRAPREGGRCGAMDETKVKTEFQSAPPVKGGDHFKPLALRFAGSFNPRPP